MTITVIKEGPYYATEGTPISFSSLRTNFKEINSGKVSASEFIRNTSLTESNPIVPDATENAHNVTTTDNGISLTQFRNSIKRYKIRQSTVGGESAETNFDIDAQTWNSNLGKNIQKTFEVTGVIGATSTANAAATFNATAYNLTIAVYGHILGKGGAAGTLNGGNGGNGGPALSVTNQVEKAITIHVHQNAQIWGGGGGGGGGNKGADGSPGAAGSYSVYTKTADAYSTNLTACRADHGTDVAACAHIYALCRAAGGVGSLCFENGNDDCGKDYGKRRKNYQISCDVPEKGNYDTTVSTAGGTAGTGGTGGNGGVGAGYNQAATNAPALDTTGGPVTAPALNTTGGPTSGGGGTATAGGVGGNGITGGNGGDYGVDGTAANPGGKGGSAGRAIAGSNYGVTGASADTVKGLYKL